MADKYPNFAALAAGETLGVDYRIHSEGRSTPIVVIAPHGGWIEPGTSEIARAIAREDLSLYLFEGLRPGRPHSDLHITSTRFDEPVALALVGGAATAVAIHGRADAGDPDTVGLGGRDEGLGDAIALSLETAGFAAASAQQGLTGLDLRNICNRGTTAAGVQLEIPRTLRDRLKEEPAVLFSFAGAVRAAM